VECGKPKAKLAATPSLAHEGTQARFRQGLVALDREASQLNARTATRVSAPAPGPPSAPPPAGRADPKFVKPALATAVELAKAHQAYSRGSP
jgi:hypothetical protein